MSATLSLDYQDAGLRRALRRLKSSLHPAQRRMLLRELGETIKGQIQRRFDQGRGPDGKPWKPSLRALAERGQTLKHRGILRDSFGVMAYADSVEVGTNLPYAAAHQFGAAIKAKSSRGLRFRIGGQWVRKPGVTLPARPFLGLSAQDEEELCAVIELWAAKESA